MKSIVVGSLATYRLSKLIIDDAIFNEIREPVISYLEDNGYNKLAYLFQCPWCISMYTGVLVSLLQKDKDFKNIILNTLSYSAVSGIIDIKIRQFI